MTSYEYIPLDEDEIRVIILQPGPPEDFSVPLTIEIEHQSLKRSGDEFEALSYVWGDATVQHKLQCSDNKHLNITRNLEIALFHLRLESSPRALWVDALCINHEDAAEKEGQIELVQPIFSAAKKTIVWVGEETDDAATALEYLDSLDERWQQILTDHVVSGTSTDSMMDLYDAFHQSLGFRFGHAFENFDEDRIQRAIAMLITRPWFCRAWVVPEFIFASEIEMQCGNLTCDWPFARSAVKLALEEHKLTWNHVIELDGRNDFFRAMQQTLMMQSLREAYRQGQMFWEGDFLEIMKRFRAAQTTRAEDKVWAFIPLVHTGSSTLPLRIRYGLSKEQLYAAVATYFVERDQGWMVLAAATRSPRLATNMPSWIPDWSESPVTTSFAESFSNSTGRRFTAGGRADPGNDGQNFFVDGTVLHATGSITHEVSLINELKADCVSGAKNLSRVVAIWQDLKTVMERWPYAKYITGESLESIRTAIFYAGQTTEPRDTDLLGGEYGWDPLNDLEVDIPIDPSHPDSPIIRDFVEAANEDPLQARTIARAVAGRKLAILSDSIKGYWHIGLVPSTARDGDSICILRACSVPLVLRRTTDGHYRLIGDCYVYGVMEGELMGSIVWQDIGIE